MPCPQLFDDSSRLFKSAGPRQAGDLKECVRCLSHRRHHYHRPTVQFAPYYFGYLFDGGGILDGGSAELHHYHFHQPRLQASHFTTFAVFAEAFSIIVRGTLLGCYSAATYRKSLASAELIRITRNLRLRSRPLR